MNTIQERMRNSRVLAIDVRPRRIGYVCLGESNKLLAATAARFTSRGAARARLASIFDECQPAVLVLRCTKPGSWRDWPGTRVIQRLARTQARRHSTEILSVNEAQLARFYRAHNFHNKNETAAFLVTEFPELAPYELQARKPWEPEHRYMLIFDAAVLALVYLAT